MVTINTMLQRILKVKYKNKTIYPVLNFFRAFLKFLTQTAMLPRTSQEHVKPSKRQVAISAIAKSCSWNFLK